MRGVHRIGAVNPAGRNDADGRLLLLHHTDLHRRSLRAQEHLFSDIEGILRIARRVIRRNIQRLKVIVIPLDLRAGGYLKAHAEEDFLYLIEHNRERVLMAKRAAFAGHRYINALVFQLPGSFLRLELLLACFHNLLNIGAHFIGQLTNDRALLRREFPHLLQYGGQLALFAQKTHAGGIQPRTRFDFCELLPGRFPD